MHLVFKLALAPLLLVLLPASLVGDETLYKMPYGYYLGLFTGRGAAPLAVKDPMSKCIDPEACPWLSSGDVLISVCPKCGNNWIMTVVHEIRTVREKSLQEFDDLLQVSPWINMKKYPGLTDDNFHDAWGNAWNNSLFPFRQFKANGPPVEHGKLMKPVRERPDLKYLVMVRKPEDQVFSTVKFADVAMPKEFRQLWGGMPGIPKPTIDTLLYIASWSDAMLPHQFFKGWWDYRHEPNVMLVHYTNVFNDPVKYIKKIADFVGVENLTEDELEEIRYRVSIDFMKDRNHKYQQLMGRNSDKPMVAGLEGKGQIRKGGSSGNKFNEEQRKILHDIGVKSIGEELNELLENGFEV